ncbi:protoglobin domain-containing protein [Tistrella bauzanensis]
MTSPVTTSVLDTDRLRFLGLDARTVADLALVRPVLEAEIEGLLDLFYKTLATFPPMRALIDKPGMVDHLKQAQKIHWTALVSGRFDADYAARAARIGNAHVRIGLEPRWYIGGYQLVLQKLLAALSHSYRWSQDKRDRAQAAITRWCSWTWIWRSISTSTASWVRFMTPASRRHRTWTARSARSFMT